MVDSNRLTSSKPLPQAPFHRVFGSIFFSALLLHFYFRLASFSTFPFFVNLALFISDAVLAFMWFTTQGLRVSLIRREEFVNKLETVVSRNDFPRLDVFVCTADPYKEPPIGLINTVLSVMAYDYPRQKLSVYVSDDGGSSLTLFALLEAAKFACHWITFCNANNLVDRSPHAYFSQSNGHQPSDEGKIRDMYEEMKEKVENSLEKGEVDECHLTTDEQRKALKKWSESFKRQDHPAVVEVLLDDSSRDVDGNAMPNLFYVAREKRVTSPHHFKAGALNALIRTSAVLSNAPVVLTLDCDMYSNDPETPLRALCHFCDPETSKNLAYLQFPQRFRGINYGDIYAGEYQRLYQIQAQGFDGLQGPNYLGSACFFNRRAFFGPPGRIVEPEIPQLHPNRDMNWAINSEESLRLAHKVAGCNYEESTDWGDKIGIRYGSLSEDLLTGYLMKCEGWRGNFTYPKRAAFLGDAPTCFIDMLNQQKRWSMGLLQICFSKFSPLKYGVRPIGLSMAMGYSQYAYWSFWSIPIMTYALIPQLGVLHGVSVFPDTGTVWFWIDAVLFVGSYGQDATDFVIGGGSVLKWWNDQRIWAARGVSCCLFGGVEYFLKWVGLSSFSFNVTSKVQDDGQLKRYQNGLFEFGAHSAMFTSMTVVAVLNLAALFVICWDSIRVTRAPLPTLPVAFFGVLNCWPIYHAALLRNDAGKLPLATLVTALLVSVVLYFTSSILF